MKRLAVLLLAALISACGGSGGGGTADNPPPAPPPGVFIPPTPGSTSQVSNVDNPPIGNTPLVAATYLTADQQEVCYKALDHGTISAADTGSFASFVLKCHILRIPGLLLLREYVSDSTETKTPLGAIIDGNNQHGVDVAKVAGVAADPNLFETLPVSLKLIEGQHVVLKEDVVKEFRGLIPADYHPQGVIVNISQANLFSTYANKNDDWINYQDIQNANALMVVPTGNHGDSGTTINPGTDVELIVPSNQPAHDLAAIAEIYAQTKSILLVTGLQFDSNGDPSGKDPAASPCGDAMNYCVAAPYTVWDEFGPYPFKPGFWEIKGITGTSFASPMVFGTLVNLRYVWDHLTNEQLVKLACETAEDLGDAGIDATYGCGQFSVEAIWDPTTDDLVDDPETEFSLAVTSGSLSFSGASLEKKIVVTGYENNEFKRDYAVTVPASSSETSLKIEPSITWSDLNSIAQIGAGSAFSIPFSGGSAARLFRDAFVFAKNRDRAQAVGVSHASGFSVAFEREANAFFGSVGSGSYNFGDTNKIIASFDRRFSFSKKYGMSVRLAAAYGKMEPEISLIKSANGRAGTAQAGLFRATKNFEAGIELTHNTGLKGTVSVQNTDYKLKPVSETSAIIKMRFVR